MKNKFEKEAEIEKVNQLINYTEQLERKQQELKTFKHDYLNIILSLKSIIETNDIKIIKRHFNEINQYSTQILTDNQFKFDDLAKINVLLIKGIFLSKFFSWPEHIIKCVTFECNEEINNFHIDNIVLIRVIGILLDNAQEEISSQKKNKFIHVGIINETENIEIIIENSLQTELPHFNKLIESGYTTKNGNSGIGLNTVKSFTDRHKNLYLYSSISNSKKIFSVSLLIEKSI